MEIQIYSATICKAVTLTDPVVFNREMGICGVKHEDYVDIIYRQYPNLFKENLRVFTSSSDYCSLEVCIETTENGNVYRAVGDLNANDSFVQRGKNERTKNMYANHPFSTCYNAVFDKAAALATGIKAELLVSEHPELEPLIVDANYADDTTQTTTVSANSRNDNNNVQQNTTEETASQQESSVENNAQAEDGMAESTTATETETSPTPVPNSNEDRIAALSAFVFQSGKYAGKTLAQIEAASPQWFEWVAANAKNPKYNEAIEYGKLKGLIK